MPLDPDACYAALIARDRRFDGLFFVGVRTTRIYCRPICPARTPLRRNTRFYSTAAAAELAGHRPCLRCRPELAPGAAPVDDAGRVLAIITSRIAAGALDGAGTVDTLAAEVELTARQVRRIVHEALGVTPIQLAQTRRLLLAKQLLTDTNLPIATVASASGFASVRRFGALFASRYRLAPSALRRASPSNGAATSSPLTLRLCYRPPFDFASLLAFFHNRAIPGVEHVTGTMYTRLVELPAPSSAATSKPGQPTIGWFSLAAPTTTSSLGPAQSDAVAQPRHELLLSLSPGLESSLTVLVPRIRAMFDLDCRPDLIAAHLSTHPALAASIAARPGLRVPGGFDPFEVACRAVLGQQVSISAARTLASRLVSKFGSALPPLLAPPHPTLTHLFPTASSLAALNPQQLASIGLPITRAATLHRLAQAIASGTLSLAPGTPSEVAIAQLRQLSGIGPWTASYIVMRALRWPDAFPGTDLILKRALITSAKLSDFQIEQASTVWSPWRSYAAAHLWASSAPPPTKVAAKPGKPGKRSKPSKQR